VMADSSARPSPAPAERGAPIETSPEYCHE
jgi:hypothetical protein